MPLLHTLSVAACAYLKFEVFLCMWSVSINAGATITRCSGLIASTLCSCYFNHACRWDELMADIEGGMFGDKEYFKPLVDSVHNMKVGNDWFLLANDFAGYLDAQVGCGCWL